MMVNKTRDLRGMAINWVYNWSSQVAFFTYLGWNVKFWSFWVDRFQSISQFFRKQIFFFKSVNCISNNLLCCSIGSSWNFLQLCLSDSWWLTSLMYFSTSIITTVPPLSTLVIISFLLQVLPFLFVPLWIDWVLDFSFFSFLLCLSHFVLNQ